MTDARALLRKHGLAPKRSFGQNFLVAPQVVTNIARGCVEDAETANATVVEIGAGTGALTAELLLRAPKVIAIERDRDLLPVLQERFAAEIASGHLILREADAQSVDLAACFADAPGPRILCGNLPYQITGKLLQHAIGASAHLDRAVFMVQMEVADRLVAVPSTKEYGALSVFVQAAFAVKKLFNVSRGSFHPAPDVTSAIIRLEPFRPPRAVETEAFRAVVKRAFETRRKTLRNSWRGIAADAIVAEAAEKANVALELRGEVLDVEAFARMAAELVQLKVWKS